MNAMSRDSKLELDDSAGKKTFSSAVQSFADDTKGLVHHKRETFAGTVECAAQVAFQERTCELGNMLERGSSLWSSPAPLSRPVVVSVGVKESKSAFFAARAEALLEPAKGSAEELMSPS